MNFVKKITSKTNFSRGVFGGVNETTINMHRTDNKPNIDTSDVKKIVATIYAAGLKKGKNPQIMVRAIGPTDWHSFTMSDDGTIDIQEFEDYFAGRVKNTKKFSKFSQLEIHVYSE